jgi:hypothetical protein
MLYCRQNPTRDAEANFNRLIGQEYRQMQSGLEKIRWHDFYCIRLRMTEARIASPNDLHYIIGSRGPAVIAVGGASGHSMVMAGYDLYRGRWLVLDPAGREELDFEDDVITAGPGATPSPADTGPARLRGYRTGQATWSNMSRWFWIFDTTITERVYHY